MREMEVEHFLNREKLENLEQEHIEKLKECDAYREECEKITVLMTH